jgi:adenylylsulfate kinase
MPGDPPGFAIWITGLPASGKSTVAGALAGALAARGIRAAILESDAVRRVLTPRPTYSDEERETFYGALAFIGALLVDHGVPVIFDATAPRRRFRDRARERIARFVEVYVECPLEVCRARDPKGLYRMAERGEAPHLPGARARYEPPERAELVVRGDTDLPADAARRIVDLLEAHGYLAG